tara:strand:- start:602 stop:979 length:378 start_codon:yes stop_codon:yes gene_type:complete
MSIESDYIINQINQAPKDFKGDEGDFIIDKIKQFNDHEILWSVFVGEPKGKDYEAFVNASISEKEQMLKSKARDTDDALWRSKEWMRISGNPEAEENYIPSALEYINPFTKDLPQGDTMNVGDFG